MKPCKFLAPLALLGVTAPAVAVDMSPSYLAGDWCFVEAEVGEDRTPENITYIFRENGTLLYQTNPATPVEAEGRYTIGEEKLTIEPALVFLPKEILEIEDDGFVIGSAVARLHFIRGRCR